MDTSAPFLAAARAAAPAGVEFVEHHATRAPFPKPALGADVIFARFVLAHLSDIPGAVSGWLSQLHPLGVLVIEETEAIETANPAFRDYLALAERLVASRGGTLYAGSALARLAGSSPIRMRANGTRRVPVAASRAAEMFALNLGVWRSDSALDQPPDTLDDLAHRLDRLCETGDSGVITWTIRQLALSPVMSPGSATTAG